MKEEIFNNEYIDNKEQVYNILKKKAFKLDYKGVHDKMYRYTFYIDNTSFEYFEGLGHEKLNNDNLHEKVINALWCIINDADTLTFFKSIDSFMTEFGYLDYKQALKVFKGCKQTKEKLVKLFTRQELNILQESLNL